MTNRLYYNDSYLTQFEAIPIELFRSKKGFNLRLDQTAFYPTSGGQPHDTGEINGFPVTDVWEDQDGEIWHTLDGDPGKTQTVQGNIDWPRRFDHMQQHSGQHLLSNVCLDSYGGNTIGFHIGSVTNTIDLDIENLAEDEITQIETEVNNLVWENIPVSIRFINDEEVKRFPFRKEPKVTGEIRVIEINRVDFSACGGTHVHATGEIGLIKIVDKEKYKQGIRLTFLCGGRALRHYQENLATLQNVSAGLSIHPAELGTAIDRFRSEIVDSHRKIKEIKKNYLPYEAENIWKTASEIRGLRRIHAIWADRDYDDIKILADYLRQYEKTIMLLAVTENDNLRIICTRSNDLVNFNSSRVLKEVLNQLGGRGGGSPEYAQGGANLSTNLPISEIMEQALEET